MSKTITEIFVAIVLFFQPAFSPAGVLELIPVEDSAVIHGSLLSPYSHVKKNLQELITLWISRLYLLLLDPENRRE